MSAFLDKSGLTHLWGKIKDAIDTAINGVAPLVGTTETVTPAQAIEALKQGRPVVITVSRDDDAFTISAFGIYSVTGYDVCYGFVHSGATGGNIIYGASIQAQWFEQNFTIPDIPAVTGADAGKFLRVNSSGKWVAESIPDAEEVSF